VNLLVAPFVARPSCPALPARLILAPMPKRPIKSEPEQVPLPRWAIHKAAHRLIWVDEVEAADEAEAIAKASEQLRLPAAKLIATTRG